MSGLALQAAWRGSKARREYLAWQARLEAERLEAARRKAAALETLTAWLPVFVARTRFMQIR